VEYLTHVTFSRFPDFAENKGRSPFGGGDNINSGSSGKPWEYSDRKYQLHEISKTVGLDAVMEALHFTGKFTDEAQLSKVFCNEKFVKLIDDNFESFSGDLFGGKIESVLYTLSSMQRMRHGFTISDDNIILEYKSYTQETFQNTFTQCLIALIKYERGEYVDPGLYEWAYTFISSLDDVDIGTARIEPFYLNG
jgi:hypothetical protein